MRINNRQKIKPLAGAGGLVVFPKRSPILLYFDALNASIVIVIPVVLLNNLLHVFPRFTLSLKSLNDGLPLLVVKAGISQKNDGSTDKVGVLEAGHGRSLSLCSLLTTRV